MRIRIGAAVMSAVLVLVGAAPVMAQEAGRPVTVEESARRREAPRPETGRAARLLAVVEDELGLSRREIVAGLASGQTLADLAEAQGSSGEALVTALEARLSEFLDEAVAAGKITDEQADRIRERAGERIETFVFETHRRAGRRAMGSVERVRARALQIIAEVVDMTPQDLRDALAEGSTVAEIAAERGVDVEELVDALMAPLEERADALVASGRVDADKVVERLDRIRARIIERLTTRR